MNIQGKIILKKGREQSIERFHPWIFSGGIQSKEGNTADGSWVEIQNYKKKTLGYGHYQNGSIAVRVLSFGDEPLPDNFWEQRIARALRARKSSGLPADHTNAFRLIHGEGDGLPGLIVDVYDGVAVVQAHDA
ncbi:MAG TPA: class I SAM-dependent rRNA methyltransferase, partial [Ohtaekwangia sp.]